CLDNRLPTEQMLHAFQQGADATAALVRNRLKPLTLNTNFSCSVPMRNCDLGLLPASNHATRSSRVSIGVMSTWSRAMQIFRRKRAAALHGGRKGVQLGSPLADAKHRRQPSS